MGFFDKIKNTVLSFVNDEFLEAITASCALVAYADGEATAEEKQKMLTYMKINPDLKHFKLSQIEEKYERFVEAIEFSLASGLSKNKNNRNDLLQNSLNLGQIECYKAIEKIKDNRDNAQKLVAVCIAVASSDGDIDEAEVKVIKNIVTRLGLRIQEYNL